MNKLDYLAQKEEELRKLNDQLDSKKRVLMDNQADLENKKEEGD
jgi:GTPase involved in cell partitioning and DNA repair